MSEMAQVRLTEVFVELADTLVDDFDLLDFLHGLTEKCVEILGVSAAGLMLTDERGRLRVVAASTERTRLLELFQLQTEQGPCVDCFRTGRPVSEADLPATDRWPHFGEAAAEVGFAAVHALPMRLRAEVIGALNLFHSEPHELDEETRRVGQALADVATIGLLQQRAIRHRDSLTEQLQTALDSRVLIEQAKGVLAERLDLDVADAFTRLRDESRNRNLRLSDLARSIVDGSDQIFLAVLGDAAD
ncbi:ANTAR domain protein [Streptomyces albus]|uniref:ANTAR domain protein n=2 Tax=Streptomyces TaxID=1883 RepID=A0A0B5EZ80_STRA4|nr:ANTAR domain protein [Streptomyces albus]AOU77654.1 ANTAR domain protein [Streptomyces albus]